MPDLILLDVMMPERDGGRVLADLRNDLSLRYIPVILLTAIAREAQTLAGTGGIQSTVLSKPVQLQELLETIESHINAAKSYNQLQEGAARDPLLISRMQELHDFAGEEGWGSVLPAEGVNTNPSDSFYGQFPTRDEPGPLPTGGSAFSFPSRSEEERDGQVW
jgi:hypothetical protein